jgi:hypothetical protein
MTKQVFFTSNEVGQSDVMQQLPNLPPGEKSRLHVGVSGWQNYDIALLRKSEYMVLLDVNPTENEFHAITREIILL